jgi:hypothetical protein
MKFQFPQLIKCIWCVKFQLHTAQHHEISIPTTEWRLLLHEISDSHSPTSALTEWNFKSNNWMKTSVTWNSSTQSPRSPQFHQLNEGFCCVKFQLHTAQHHKISIPTTEWRLSVAWNFSFTQPNVCFDCMKFQFQQLNEGFCYMNFSYSQPKVCFNCMKFQFLQLIKDICCVKFQLHTVKFHLDKAQCLLWLHEISIPTIEWRLLLHEISANHSQMSALTEWNFNSHNWLKVFDAWNFSFTQPNIMKF